MVVAEGERVSALARASPCQIAQAFGPVRRGRPSVCRPLPTLTHPNPSSSPLLPLPLAMVSIARTVRSVGLSHRRRCLWHGTPVCSLTSPSLLPPSPCLSSCERARGTGSVRCGASLALLLALFLGSQIDLPHSPSGTSETPSTLTRMEEEGANRTSSRLMHATRRLPLLPSLSACPSQVWRFYRKGPVSGLHFF